MATEVTSAQIVNSSVDNSPIGATTPNTGAFSTLTGPTVSTSDDSTNAATTAWVNAFSVLGFTFSHSGSSGYIKLPGWLGGFILQWVQGATQSTSGSTQTVDLPVTFPTSVLSVMVGTVNENGGSPTDTNMALYQEVSRSTSNVVVFMMRNADHAFDPAAPTVWAVGY